MVRYGPAVRFRTKIKNTKLFCGDDIYLVYGKQIVCVTEDESEPA